MGVRNKFIILTLLGKLLCRKLANHIYVVFSFMERPCSAIITLQRFFFKTCNVKGFPLTIRNADYWFFFGTSLYAFFQHLNFLPVSLFNEGHYKILLLRQNLAGMFQKLYRNPSLVSRHHCWETVFLSTPVLSKLGNSTSSCTTICGTEILVWIQVRTIPEKLFWTGTAVSLSEEYGAPLGPNVDRGVEYWLDSK